MAVTPREDQRVIIHVVELDVEPDGPTQKAAGQRAIEIARRDRASAAAQGGTSEEADPVIDEALLEVRRGSRRLTPADDQQQRT